MQGRVKAAYPSKGYYSVVLYDGAMVVCRVGDAGTGVAYSVDETVLVALGGGGPIILCRIPGPVPPPTDKDDQKNLDQLLAEQAEALQAAALGISTSSGIPSFSPQNGDLLGDGEAFIESKTSGARFGTYSDGSLLMRSSKILFAALLAAKQAAVITAKRFFLNIVPGFVLKIYTTDKQKNPQVGSQADKVKDPVVRLEASLASDPANPKTRDLAVEAGGLRESDDLDTGQSKASAGKKLTRGLRLALGDFGLIEADNTVKELRLTVPKQGDVAGRLHQMRINQNEVVLSWGDQFLMLNDSGFFIKANSIGFAGPWVMWDPAKTAQFTNKDTPAPLNPTCEFVTGARGPGIKFNENVYFGSGAYFGKKSEPAVLQSFVTQIYAQDIGALIKHVHGYTPPAVVTLISPDLAAQLGPELAKLNVPDYYS